MSKLLTLGVLQQGTLLNYLRWLFSYKTRVETDSGEVQDLDVTRSVYKILSDYKLSDNMKLLITAEGGLKTRTSGVEKYVIKAYDLSDSDIDPAQTTESSQPFLGGRIAPNEIQNFKSVTGVTKTLTHTGITVSGTYTIIKVLNAENDSVNPENSGKTVVSFTEVTEGTYNSISWTGKLYAYGIYGGTISEANQALIETDLLNLVAEVESVVIGNQEWATSNCEMVATPMGNVMAEMQTASAVEKVTVEDDRTFASDTGFWAKAGESTINNGGSGVCNILSSAGDYSAITSPADLLPFGVWIKLSYNIIRNENGGLASNNWLLQTIPSSVGSHSVFFKNNIITQLNIKRLSGVTDIDIDNISVQELGWADSQELYDGLIAQGYTAANALKEVAEWCYHNNDTARGTVYGKLYNGYGRTQLVDDIATKADWGWHVATEAELTTLAGQGGYKLKVSGTDYWTTDTGTNETGFTALGGGNRSDADGLFGTIKNTTAFWCADSDKVLVLNHDDNTATITAVNKGYGAYIRLVKDSE